MQKQPWYAGVIPKLYEVESHNLFYPIEPCDEAYQHYFHENKSKNLGLHDLAVRWGLSNLLIAMVQKTIQPVILTFKLYIFMQKQINDKTLCLQKLDISTLRIRKNTLCVQKCPLSNHVCPPGMLMHKYHCAGIFFEKKITF